MNVQDLERSEVRRTRWFFSIIFVLGIASIVVGVTASAPFWIGVGFIVALISGATLAGNLIAHGL